MMMMTRSELADQGANESGRLGVSKTHDGYVAVRKDVDLIAGLKTQLRYREVDFVDDMRHTGSCIGTGE